MEKTGKLKVFALAALVSSVVFTVVACGDDDGVEPAKTPEGVTTGTTPQVPDTLYSHIPACDQYLNAMQNCVNLSASAEEQGSLKKALEALGERFSKSDDEQVLTQQCEEALLQIDEHKKALGCS